MKYTDVTLLVAPFGFGSLGKGLAIAEEFLRQGFSVKILCDEVAQAVVRPSGIPTARYEYREELNLEALNTRVVISSGDIGTPVVKNGTSFVIVDSLFWLRGKWERMPSSDADIYIAQKFFIDAVDDAKKAIGDRLQFVDAILPGWAQDGISEAQRNLMVVYPGGMRSPVLTEEYQQTYLSWIEAVLSAAIKRSPVGKQDLVAVIPLQMLESSATERIRSYSTVLGAGVDVLGSLLKKAHSLIVAPGIETMLEATALGLTPHFLPAYNGSHIPQLIAYRQAGIGDELSPSYAAELRDFEKDTDWLNKLTMDVAKKNLESLSDEKYKKEAVEKLIAILGRHEERLPTYPLGKEGSVQIVELVRPYLVK